MYKHHGRPKLVIPDEMKEEVLIVGHSQVFSGHHGVFKTHRRILEVCWWPELYRDIETYIKCCRVCAMTKSYNRKRGCLEKRQFQGKTIEFVSFDFIVELPLTARGSIHILTIVDNFTKCTKTYAIKR